MEAFYDVKLDANRKEHLYVQLYKVIKAKILAGEILANEKLPPIRTYANALEVNNITVVNAYKLLEQHALVYKKVGSGTYVRSQSEQSAPANHTNVLMNHDLPGQVDVTIGINMASTTPSDYLFPVEHFKVVLNEVLDRDKGGAFGYQDSRGYLPLREIIVKELKQTHGIVTTPEHLQILSGAQQGLDVISKAIVQYGDTVIVEAPTYTGAIATFRSRGARILELPLEQDGPNLMKLREFIYQYRPKLLYMMPNFQNPTGVVYSQEKRQELLALAQKHQLMIIEDDYCSELAFDGSVLHPLKALDADDLVVYIKSFSKAIMPGLRLGYMVTPERLRQQVILAKQSTDITTSGLTQRAFERFIAQGFYEAQKELMFETFKLRYHAAAAAIEQFLSPYCSWDNGIGGLHFWIKITSGITSKRLYEQLKKRGVLMATGDTFYATKLESPYFRLTIASVETEDLVYGIRVIGAILNELLEHQSQSDYQLLL